MAVRRWSIIVFITLLVTALLTTLVVKYLILDVDEGEAREAQMQKVMEYTDQFNSHNLDVMFLGMAPNGPENLVARQIRSVQEALDSNMPGKSGKMLIICDQNTSVILQPEEFKQLEEALKKGNFYLVYFGTAKYQMMIDAGLLTEYGREDKESVIFFYKNGGMFIEGGFADDRKDVPFYSLRQSLTPQEKPVYTMIYEMATHEIYW